MMFKPLVLLVNTLIVPEKTEKDITSLACQTTFANEIPCTKTTVFCLLFDLQIFVSSLLINTLIVP